MPIKRQWSFVRSILKLLSVLQIVLSSRQEALSVADFVVVVPEASINMLIKGKVHKDIRCDPPPTNGLTVQTMVTLASGEGDILPVISPENISFSSGQTVANFTATSKVMGRFYLKYSLDGPDAKYYRLSVDSTLLTVSDKSEGWESIWLQLSVNLLVFIGGLVFFAWRRWHSFSIPFWQHHEEGLFEPVNYLGIENEQLKKKYGPVMGNSMKERASKFFAIPCDGSYVANACGINAALSLRMHLDMGHFFTLLSITAALFLIPVNVFSGTPDTSIIGNSYQRTTISNVPLHSGWYWAHVLFCYIVTAGVIVLLKRQYTLMFQLQKRTTSVIGNRSIFIRSGLPTTLTSYQFQKMVRELYPSDIQEAVVIHELQRLYTILEKRIDLCNEIERLRELDILEHKGTVPSCLVWCPGSNALPSLSDCCYNYFHCIPCSKSCNYCGKSSTHDVYHSMENNDEDGNINNPRIAKRLKAISDQLNSFPNDILDLYKHRNGTGGAFIIFNSVKARNHFLFVVKSHQSCCSKISANFMGYFHKWSLNLKESEESKPLMNESRLIDYMPQFVIQTAPEPNDIVWRSLAHEPFSCGRMLSQCFYQFLTFAIIIVFSTPTAVLMYLKLDDNSDIYAALYSQHMMLISLLATYLPSLLLIVVNWLLLTFLFYISTSEPWYSESKRMRSFMTKGFFYLTVSSILLPLIGVTAVYTAIDDYSTDKSYVETFMYNVSGTFFITYVSQRAFLGSIVQLLRLGERGFNQPYMLSRAITKQEKIAALKPDKFLFGYDYAMILSVFFVVVLGSGITPVLIPFGAIYFYIKVFAVKYNFLYVMPYTPGRGLVAQSAYRIIMMCLMAYLLTMAFVFAKIAGKGEFIAILLLLGVTTGYYIWWRIQMYQRNYQYDVESPSQASSPRKTFTQIAYSLEEETGYVETYANPYDVALRIFCTIGEKHRSIKSVQSDIELKRLAFVKLRVNNVNK